MFNLIFLNFMLFVQFQIWLKPPNLTRVDLATIVVVTLAAFEECWSPAPFFWVQKLGNFLGKLFLGKKIARIWKTINKKLQIKSLEITILLLHGSNK
jgi:hypothetical protein